VLVWLSVWSEVLACMWPSWCHCHWLSLASVKSRLVLPLWYHFVVPDKGPLNGCVCVCLKSESRRYYKSKIFFKIRPPGNGLLLFVAGPPVVPAAYSRWWIITRTILLSLLPLVLFAVVVTLLFWLWRRRVLRSMHQHTASHADSTTPAVLASPYRSLGPIQLLEVKVFSNCIYCLSTLRLAMCVIW